MDENSGVKTRSKTGKLTGAVGNTRETYRSRPVKKKGKETGGACALVANRRSFPPDIWTGDQCDEPSPIKQKRTLYVRDDNVPHHNDHTYGGACGGARPKSYAVRASRPQPCSVPVSGITRDAVSMSSRKKRQRELLDHSYLASLPGPESGKIVPVSPSEWTRVPDSPIVPDDVTDIDESPDSLQSNVYAKHIMEYIQQLETEFSLKRDFLDNSPEVTTRMRGVLMDWIIQVQTHEELYGETLHLTICLIDKVLSLMDVTMPKLQLVGITCLLIASKFTERFAPQISVLCYLTEDTFSKDDVLRYELHLLVLLNWRLSRPVAPTFLDRLLQVHGADEEIDHLANYILDLSITNVELVPILPSLKAASAIYLARWLLLDDEQAWNDSLLFYSNYSESELTETVRAMALLVYKAPNSKFQGALSKYNVPDLSNISCHARVEPCYVLARCFTTPPPAAMNSSTKN